MKTDFYISNTNDLGKNEITKHLGVVSTHIVIGANFFADFFASFTDFFGGHSSAYQERLEEMFGEAKKNLIKEAKQRGANGIIGFTVDFDEISGKDKSMFMVSAIGTAVHLVEKEESIDEDNTISGFVSSKKVQETIMRLTIKENLLNGIWPTKERWQVMISSMPELVSTIIPSVVEAEILCKKRRTPENYNLVREFLPIYLQTIDIEEIAALLYPFLADKENIKYTNSQGGIYYITKSQIACSLAVANKVLSSKLLFELFNHFEDNRDCIFQLLSIDRPSYSLRELNDFEKIIPYFDNLPNIRRKETITTGVFSKKTEEVEICSCGAKISGDEHFCPKCFKSSRGLTKAEEDAVRQLKLKVLALNELLR